MTTTDGTALGAGDAGPAAPSGRGAAGATPNRGRLVPRPAPTAAEKRERVLRILLPVAVFVAVLALWEGYVRLSGVPVYILPPPGLVIRTVFSDWAVLGPALWNTMVITLAGLFLAAVGGGALAVLFTQGKYIEYSFYPYAIVLQVTPIVSIFPLINIYIDNVLAKLLLAVWIVAFFPVLSNTTVGLNSADRNLADLYRLYGASRWQTLRFLRLPSALPWFLGGLRIAGGLSLIGAVVAEFVGGTSGFGSGLASRLIESAYRLNMPRLFAALFLISLAGIVIYLVLSFVSHLMLRKWHESALSSGGGR